MANDRKAQLAARRLLKLADDAEPRTRQQIERALVGLQQSVDIRQLERVIASGDYFAMQDLVSNMPARFLSAVTTLRRLFVRAAREEALKLQTYGIRLQFQAVDPFMVDAARQGAGRLVTQITAETRRAIRSIITRSFQDGIAPRDAAQMIRRVIGLTERQAQSVYQYQSHLIDDGYSPSQAARMSQRFSDRLLSQRARTIARTETISAATRGQLASWRAAETRGLLPNDVRKVWITTPDDRLCRYCRVMHGESVLMHSKFPTRFGPVDGPPLHPLCRCALALKSDAMPQRRAA